MAYKVGDLELNIQTISNNTIASLDEVIKRLTTVNSMLKTTTKGTASGAIATATGGSSKTSKSSTEKSLNFGVMVTKLRMATYFAKRLGSALANVVQYGSDYTEILNKWQVAMRYNLDDADEFIKKMRTAYGISTQMLMDTQSTFKNLLSGLGGITEETSYALSESVTQMMLDFASLYNQSIESASNKFQAMIAGQIRPVRSVSGIDVSETSIYDLYTRLGGTKTMRQLNQMEKRLLRIYATFEQMQSAGATGDFAKTIEQWANQSRIMTENWKELVTWIGVGLKELLQNLQVLQYINAALITATEIVKALVYASGYEDENFLTGMYQGAEDTNEAIDELQGKLLDFDKFRAMDSSTTGGILAIDQTVLDALSSYNSQLDNAKYYAQEIANSWLKTLGFTEGENGQLEITDEALDKLKAKIKLIGITIGSIFGSILAIKIVKFFINPLNSGLALVVAGVALLVAGIERLIDGDIVNGLYLIAGAIGAIGIAISILTGSWIPALVGILIGASVAIGVAIGKHWEEIKTGFMKLINTIANAFVKVINFIINVINNGALMQAISAISQAFGGKAIQIPTISEVNWGGVGTFAQGGMPDKGSLFIAGEAGAEIVANQSNGQSAVMNMSQLQTAITNGMVKALSTMGGSDGKTVIKIGDEEVFTVVQQTAKRKGLTFAKV